MKNGFSGIGVLLLGAALAVGCGGSSQQEDESTTSASTAPGTPEEGAEWFPDRPESEEGRVGELKACCYIKCSHNPAAWIGPYRNAEPGNCRNLGDYRCGQHGWTCVGAKWDDC
ncbi:hypothetical protein [Melittangium boletus]|uniref:Lipoprotein n=1 Tax=Melittangium boletus DSM 14713 TaxID=1294270 RepID=A0A250IRQ6_9BACT|nr:hypothetical protein [Melittangium boletus]ATB33867.1 hypothetical protein MEBOL_007368 [Melittangium boletus DSM 14713]